MKEIIETIFNVYFIPFLGTVISAIIAFIAKKYHSKANDDTKKKVALDTVKYIEQVFKDLHGSEKFNKAVECAKEWLEEKGINISSTELNILIESAVNELNKKGN